MKKKSNLKRVFIFNGLLLMVAFVMIQYAVEKNDPIIEQGLKINPVVQGDFGQRLTIFDAFQNIPNIEFQTVFNKNKSLNDFNGQWVILNLWATWCPPCLVEMPSLQKLQDHFADKNFKLIAVALDRNMDGKKLRNFNNKYQFGPVAAHYGDYPSINKQVEITGLPTTYIIAPNGQAIGMYKGDADWVSDDAKVFIESLMR